MRRLLTLAVVILIMSQVHRFPLEDIAPATAFAGVALGFLLIAGFLAGEVTNTIGLPRITGYLIVGIVFGPHAMGYIGEPDTQTLRFIESLALALIALTAGGEFDMERIRPRLKAIGLVSLIQVFVVFAGVLGFVLWFGSALEFIGAGSKGVLLSVAVLLALVAVAVSPATTIAVIVETRSRGPLTDIVLGVSVIKDMAVLVLLALVLWLVGRWTGVSAGHGAVTLAWEMGGSVVGGIILAALLYVYIRYVQLDLPLFVLGAAFLATAVTESMGLHSLLVCMVAGFIIANFTGQGRRLIEAIEAGSLPVYVTFFGLAGACLDIGILRGMFIPVLAFVVLRLCLTYYGTWMGAAAAGTEKNLRRLAGLGFIGQAGISIGIATMAQSRFSGWGDKFATLVLGAVIINQLIGPVILKIILNAAGESREQRLGAILQKKRASETT